MIRTVMKEKVLHFLNKSGISYEVFPHAPITTMEEGKAIIDKLGFMPCKILFLMNKQGRYFLLVMQGDKRFSAKDVARQIGSGHLSFASSEEMNTLDISISALGVDLRQFKHTVVSNNKEGFEAMTAWLVNNHVDLADCCFAMEHTGHYSDALERFLFWKSYHYVLLPTNFIAHYPLCTKVKNDKIDSAKIADYCARFADQLSYSTLPSKTLQKLRELDKDRKLLVQQKVDFMNAIQTISDKERKEMYQGFIDSLEEKVIELEKQMLELLKTDGKLMASFILLISIPGIGLVNAVNLITIPRNFEAFDTARQLAKYTGVAPSTHTPQARACTGAADRTATMTVRRKPTSFVQPAVLSTRVRTSKQRHCMTEKPKE